MSAENRNGLRQTLFMMFGVLSLVLSYIGILLPGVPGIPFLLLAVYFLVESSPRLYLWMLRQKLLVRVLDKIQAHRTKPWFFLFVIAQLWVSVVVADLLLINNLYGLIALYGTAVIISVVSYVLLKTL